MDYGYFCEDVVQEVFIEKTLEAFAKHKSINCKAFNKDENFCNQHNPPSRNKQYVRKYYAEFAKIALGKNNYNLDLFLTAIDYDYTPFEQYNNHKQQFENKIESKLKRKFIAVIPVKSIEYWLLYIANKGKDPEREFYEKDAELNNKIAKAKVYTFKKDDKEYYIENAKKQAEIAKEILKGFDAEYLISKSPSFESFYNDIKTFCSTYG